MSAYDYHVDQMELTAITADWPKADEEEFRELMTDIHKNGKTHDPLLWACLLRGAYERRDELVRQGKISKLSPIQAVRDELLRTAIGARANGLLEDDAYWEIWHQIVRCYDKAQLAMYRTTLSGLISETRTKAVS